ncbi:hypothetical protein AMJ85_07760 [candidate division BRC1 bacterium SM23_51]|nr:MAG: hypothetical protein AMJ85_07760 [candidate division BRC1 bacterium SM23_51]
MADDLLGLDWSNVFRRERNHARASVNAAPNQVKWFVPIRQERVYFTFVRIWRGSYTQGGTSLALGYVLRPFQGLRQASHTGSQETFTSAV